MLLANKKVAETFCKRKKTALFRVHDYPDEQKIITLERITKKLGYKQNFTQPQKPKYRVK